MLQGEKRQDRSNYRYFTEHVETVKIISTIYTKLTKRTKRTNLRNTTKNRLFAGNKDHMIFSQKKTRSWKIHTRTHTRTIDFSLALPNALELRGGVGLTYIDIGGGYLMAGTHSDFSLGWRCGHISRAHVRT